MNFLEKGLTRMAIMRVWIENGCPPCGMLEINYLEVFKIVEEVNAATVKKDIDFAVVESKIKQVAMGCPVEVIRCVEF